MTLFGFYDLGRSVTPTFLFRNRCYLQLSSYCPKINKNSSWEVKKSSRFLPTGHGILPSCGCKTRETMVTKCELVVWGTSTVDKIRLIGQFKPYLGENMLYFGTCSHCGLVRWRSPIFSDLSVLPGMFSPKRSRWPPICFTFLASLTHHLSMVKFSDNNQC